MRDIKTITGGFHDDLVAALLNGMPGIRVTADQLKKSRNRFARATWPQRQYLSRPASRIQLEAAPKRKTD